MLRKFACAAVIAVSGFGVALAEEFQATITMVDHGNITFKKGKANDLGKEMTLPMMADAKVTKGKFNAATKKVDAGVAITDGLKNAQFTNISEKGVRVTITTDADNKHITAISVGGSNKDKSAEEAKITKVDAKKGTVTVKMQDKGKEVEKTFALAEDIEYADSTGRVATAAIFTSGDMVLIVEDEGTICKMKKVEKSDTAKKLNSK